MSIDINFKNGEKYRNLSQLQSISFNQQFPFFALNLGITKILQE